MKAFFITTQSNEMPQYVESLTSIGFEAERYAFRHQMDSRLKGLELEAEIQKKLIEYKPDVIVYIGASESNTPSPEFFKKLRDLCPTVHLCPDAADHPWWPELIAFEKAGSFDVQVAMDGSHWPLEDTQITALMSFDPNRYSNKKHDKREIVFGFAGDIGGPRSEYLEKLTGLKCRIRDNADYQEVCDFLGKVRMVPNIPMTGTFERKHVKWRVMETGLCGGLLLEMKGSPTPNWFDSGVDYMSWETPSEALDIVEYYRDKPDETFAFGQRLRDKIIKNHSPAVFWKRIFDRIGL